MSRKIFVNLPVKDLNRSVDFFTKCGFSFNPQFTDENATCMVVSDDIFVMLLVEPFFQSFSKREIPDPARTSEVLVCLSADTREEVDALVDSAVAAGGSAHGEPQAEGPMYGRSFTDPDGHIWEVMWMDPAALEG
ncbi:VOC family protein [Streptomyces tubbatahanensis]|uniref:VOC family protein n=1 Tax=Streptomyces tubbatahanensis TaxID=2923272 RepID=A0ABY3XSY5_9ACTN|nr:VOC family protein [Streptomyces tubbatahanensis]UNS97515.1 VOC family protein [Streptomyces tubbatahanensis]